MLTPRTFAFGAPPGTGKTHTATNLLLHSSEQIFAAMPLVKGEKEALPALHCALTRCATKLMLVRFIEEMDYEDIKSGKLVIVYVANHKETYLTAHQKKFVILMELKGKQQDEWHDLWKKPARIHVFLALGRSHMPAHVPASWANRFYVCHTNEAYQVLLAFGIHILSFLRHDGKLLLSGDHRQFAGMRTVMAVPSPYLRISELTSSYKSHQQFILEISVRRDTTLLPLMLRKALSARGPYLVLGGIGSPGQALVRCRTACVPTLLLRVVSFRSSWTKSV